MVIVCRNRPSMAAEPLIAGGSRNSTMNILGINIGERLSVSGHVKKHPRFLLLLNIFSEDPSSARNDRANPA